MIGRRLPTPRRKPARQSPQWSDAAVLRGEVLRLRAAIAQVAAAMPDHDRQIAEATLDKYAPEIAQGGADQAIKVLMARGLLRQAPARVGVVKRVVRDSGGQIIAVSERAEQIEDDEVES